MANLNVSKLISKFLMLLTIMGSFLYYTHQAYAQSSIYSNDDDENEDNAQILNLSTSDSIRLQNELNLIQNNMNEKLSKEPEDKDDVSIAQAGISKTNDTKLNSIEKATQNKDDEPDEYSPVSIFQFPSNARP